MSSLVHAKWMNSFAPASPASPATFSLMKYSIALTSWLVVASICLTRAASASEKPVATASSAARASALNGATSTMAGSSASASSQRTSTRTRRCISPDSPKIGRSAATLPA